MAIRVKVELSYGGRKARVTALANSGYETDEPEILVPKTFAVKNFRVLKRGKFVTYRAVGGQEQKFQVFQKIKVKVVTEDKESKPVEATLVVSDLEDEVILNDKLIGQLEIVLLKVHEGKWRFISDAPEIVRNSAVKETF